MKVRRVIFAIVGIALLVSIITPVAVSAVSSAIRLLSSVLEFTPGAAFSVSLPGVLRRLASSIQL